VQTFDPEAPDPASVSGFLLLIVYLRHLILRVISSPGPDQALGPGAACGNPVSAKVALKNESERLIVRRVHANGRSRARNDRACDGAASFNQGWNGLGHGRQPEGRHAGDFLIC
jgi:hypothetical protein